MKFTIFYSFIYYKYSKIKELNKIIKSEDGRSEIKEIIIQGKQK